MDMNRTRLRQSNVVEAIVLGLCVIVAEPVIARAERLPVKTYTTADGLTVLKQIAKGLSIKVGKGDEERDLSETAMKLIESGKWYLWHGNFFDP